MSRNTRSLSDLRLTARLLPFFPASALSKCSRSPATLRFCRLASGKNHQKSPRSLKVRQTPGLSIPFFKPHLGLKEISAARRVIKSGWLTTGSETALFEEEFASFLKGATPRRELWAAAVNSATAGLHLALEALGVGSGDRVAVPSLTFTSTAAVIRYLGAEPVFIDSHPENGNMDPEALNKVGQDLKAVIPVHLAGCPCDINAIRDAVSASTSIIEDAAHAFPSCTDEGFAGTLGDIGVFSFYATKTITTGEGGMIVSNNEKYHERIKIMRIHGIDRTVWTRYTDHAGAQSWEYDVVEPGYKYNLTDLAAAIGRVQLAKSNYLLGLRRNLASVYSRELDGIDNLELPRDVKGHSWHLYMLKLRNGALRDALARRLYQEGIGTSVHFIPLHRMTYWKRSCRLNADHYPAAEDLGNRLLSIPLWPGLKRREQNRIIRVIKDELHG